MYSRPLWELFFRTDILELKNTMKNFKVHVFLHYVNKKRFKVPRHQYAR
jgi:hypothetical protein